MYKNGVSINIPDVHHSIVHLIYHAVVQHRFSLGPIFLYDIKYLTSILKDKDDLINLLQRTGLEKDYRKIVSYVDKKRMIDTFGIHSQYKKLLDAETNLKKFNYLFFTKKGRLDFFNLIKTRLRNNEDCFQTSRYSFKYYYILLITLRRFILKLLKN